MARKSSSERRRAYAGLHAGVQKLWMKAGPTLIAGKSWRPQQLLDLLQRLLDAFAAQDQAYASYLSRVVERRNLEKQWRTVLRALTHKALASHAGDARALAVFALSEPRKPGPRTLAAKVEMIGKAKATRARRATPGPGARRKR